MKKVSEKKIWKKLRIRRDWIGMPYLVLNIGEEYADFFDMPEDAQKMSIVRYLGGLFDEFSSNDLNDILSMKQQRIKYKDEYIESILIWFRPIFKFTSFRNIFLTSIIISLLLNYFYS